MVPYKSKDRIITIISCDKKDKRPYNHLPLQRSVEVEQALANHSIPMDANSVEILELTEKIEVRSN